MKKQTSGFFDKLLKDKHGRVVIAQKPNALIIAAGVLFVGSLLSPDGSTLQSVIEVLFRCALIAWGLLELFGGVNWLRRLMGLFVIIWVVRVLL